MIKDLEALNITIMDVPSFIERKDCKEVTSHAMFESGTSRFFETGLFSEALFGQVGSKERLIRRGFIDLHTTVFTPHLFKQILTLKSYYQDILAGRAYAKFDNELKDLVLTTNEDVEGNTGYQFFMETYPKIKFATSNSEKRMDKIKLLEKYKDKTFIDKFIVIPAGLRDVKEDHGRMTSEDINKLYLGLLSLSKSVPVDGSTDPIYDGIRYQMQMKIQEIYNYIANILEGKGGYAQSKYTARSITYGTRNVITAYPISRSQSPSSPQMLKMGECICPLFQYAKNAQPLVIYWIKNAYTDAIFSQQNYNVSLINPDTLELEMQEVTENEIKKFTTSDGISDMINDFRNKEIQHEPVMVETKDRKKYYLQLVYDDEDVIYMFRSLQDFKASKRSVSNYDDSLIQDKEAILAHLGIEDYILVGSSALGIYGMNKYYTEEYKHSKMKDIDILVSDEDMQKIKSDIRFKKEQDRYRSEELGIDVYNDLILKMYNKTYKEFKQQNTEVVGHITVADPEILLDMYKRTPRIKDKYKIEFLKSISFDMSKVRPLTMIEMIYTATYGATRGKHTTATRYPIANLEGICTFRIHLISTSPGRIVKWMRSAENDSKYMELPEYPIIGGEVQTSMSMHPNVLEQFKGD